jgi:hypothetical protein
MKKPIIALIAFGMMWMAIVWPICNYYINRSNNLLQWEAVETYNSKQSYERQESGKRLFDLYYRILPSEFNTFVRIFGDNKWILKYEDVELENKEDFIKHISDYKTLSDIRMTEERVRWMHP